MKKLILLFIFILDCLVFAAEVPAGSIMCKNPDSVRTLVELDKSGKAMAFLDYYSEMEMAGVCSETIASMRLSGTIRFEHLPGGVTRIGDLYVPTKEVR